MRNRRSGPPQLQTLIACVACLIACTAAEAQAPSNALRDGAPRPNLRPDATPQPSGAAAARAPAAVPPATPSGKIMPATSPTVNQAGLIPTVPPPGSALPMQLRITGNAPSNEVRVPATLTPTPPTAPPDGATDGGSQLEIRRPAATAPIVAPAAPPGVGEVRIVPPAASAPPATSLTPAPSASPAASIPPTVAAPSAPAKPLTPIVVPTPSLTPTAIIDDAQPPAGAPSIAPAPIAIGGDETNGPISVPVAPPLLIGGKPPASAPNSSGNDPSSSALPGLPQLPSSGLPPVAPSGNPAPAGKIASAPLKTVAIEAVDFNGVTLGQTTLDETIEAWGQPLQRNTDGTLTRCRYLIAPFAGVDVAFRDGKSLSIIIDLGAKFPPDAVAQELGITDVPPVAVEDEQGRVLGVVYPERGTSFRFSPDGDKQVVQIGLDRIDPRPFVLRAERTIGKNDSAALADAETAIRLDAAQPRAHWIKARVLSACGRRREALTAVEAALERDPKGAEYLLTRAALLAEAGLFDAALTDGQTILNGTPGAPHLQARAWLLRGDLLAEGPIRDYEEAIDAHTRAVRLAEPLVNEARPAVRRAAKEVLIDAHLAIANDVAWGNWQRKDVVVPQWLQKAEQLAEAWIADGDLLPDVRLTVDRKALTACVGVQGAVDPHVWVEKMERHTDEILTQCDDPLRCKRLQYEAGLGLYDALQSHHARGDVENALQCGEAAVELLQLGREGRDETPTDPYRYGRLYFRIGSIYAVKKQDHAQAVEWFDRAAPLLERPLPDAAKADRGRQGETLVSMGVSYWAVGKRERALELTNAGSRYMQQAAADGTLAAQTLAVPYTNLAVMHRQLGDESSGKRFQELATRAETGGGLRR